MGRKNKHKKQDGSGASGSKSTNSKVSESKSENGPGQTHRQSQGKEELNGPGPSPTTSPSEMHTKSMTQKSTRTIVSKKISVSVKKDGDLSLGPPVVPKAPKNSIFAELYERDEKKVGQEVFKNAVVKAFEKYGIALRNNSREVVFSSPNPIECRLEWNSELLPPKMWAVEMLIKRVLHNHLQPGGTAFLDDCGMKEADRKNWKFCTKASVCNACYSACIARFKEAGTGAIYEFGETKVVSPKLKKDGRPGYFNAEASIREILVRASYDGTGQRSQITTTTVHVYIKDNPNNTHKITPELHVVMANLVVRAAGVESGDAEGYSLPFDSVESDDSDGTDSDDDDFEIGFFSASREAHNINCQGYGCPICRIFGCGKNIVGKLCGLKAWRMMEVSPSDKQFILRLAKKYHIEASQSKILQFILVVKNGSTEDTVPQTGLPKFARVKTNKRKVLTRKDFGKFEPDPEEIEKLFQPFAYLDLLDKNIEDAIFLLALADTIGLGKLKGEMIAVIEKNFGCDVRIEQFCSELKKSHKTIEIPTLVRTEVPVPNQP